VETSTTIELNGTLGVKDLARIQYFHALRLWPLAAVVITLLGLLFLFNLAMAGNPGTYFQSVVSNAAPFEFLLIAWVVVVVGIMPYVNARRSFAQLAELREPTTYTFNAEGIVAARQSMTWRVDWGMVKRVRETKSAYIVYRSPKLVAVLLPKRFFLSEAEMTHWRDLVAAHILPRRIERPGFIARWC
jgi:hypothetical protein